MTDHPAKYSKQIIPILDELVGDGVVLDVFGGTGRIHQLKNPRLTISHELEWEWANEGEGCNVQGNALHLPFRTGNIDTICTSCTYANRMADKHNARDGSKRNTYKHTLGRDLHPDNSGGMQWGEAYREFHQLAWTEALRVLHPEGRFVLNISNHIRKGKEIDVCGWHHDCLESLGLRCVRSVPVATRRQRQGANGNLRVGCEMVFLFTR